MTPRLTWCLILALSAPVGASAQSLFAGAGLGSPSEVLEGRARALGGIGVGLRGPSLSAADPAAAAQFVLPTVVIMAQPSWVELTSDASAETRDYRGTRFPQVGIAYPLEQMGVVTLSLESVLDQRFRAERPVSYNFGGDIVDGVDRFTSDGGVSQIRLGFARSMGRDLDIGLSFGRYAGSLRRTLERAFGDEDNPTNVEPYEASGEWSYTGTALVASAEWSPGIAQVGASVTWSSGLDATASEATQGQSRVFHLPLTYRVGASAILAPGLSLSSGVSLADWSGLDDDLTVGTSRGMTTSFGVGVELARARFLGRTTPLRFGYRNTDLPFSLRGDRADESAWSAGIGFPVSQAGEVIPALLDVAIERGTRTDVDLTESFWRATLSVRVSGL